MGTKATHIVFALLVAIMVVSGLIAYPHLPEQVASHWNLAGTADGYTSKFWSVLTFLLLLAGLYILYALIIKVDPLKANIKAFRGQYNLFFVSMSVFFVYLFALVLAWNLGWQFNLGAAILPACALLLWVIGMITEKSKRNWFIGIRTPWTLSNDNVWRKTHVLGGRLFKAAAVLPLAGLLLDPALGFYLFIVPVVAIAVFTVVYSYVVYKDERSKR